MKKLLVFFLAVSLLTACKDKEKGKMDRDKTDISKDDYRTEDDKPKDDVDKPKDESSGWSRSDENKFMTDCEGTAKENVGAARANEYCDCMLQKIKKMYSSYTQADRELAGSSTEEINKLAADCNGQ